MDTTKQMTHEEIREELARLEVAVDRLEAENLEQFGMLAELAKASKQQTELVSINSFGDFLKYAVTGR